MAERPETECLRLSLVGPAMLIGKVKLPAKHMGAEVEREETALLLSPYPEPGPQMQIQSSTVQRQSGLLCMVNIS